MKTGVRNNRYWVKPTVFEHADMCAWCFKNVGQPDDLFLGTVGQWTIDTKRCKFFFVNKEHRDIFAKVWK